MIATLHALFEPADGGGLLSACMRFWFGYLLILVVPGPNILAVCSHATIHGLSATLPLAIAIASGAGLLLASIYTLLGFVGPTFMGWLSAASVLLLFYSAYRIATARQPDPPDGQHERRRTIGSFLLFGMSCGFANPVTAAYFTAGLLGPDSSLFREGMIGPLAASAFFLSACTTVTAAVLFSRRALRQKLLANFRLTKCVIAGVIAAYGLSAAGKVLSPWVIDPRIFFNDRILFNDLARSAGLG